MNAKMICHFCAMILTGLIPVSAEITVPKLPETKLENPDSHFWLTRENWPEIINHGGVDYRLIVRIYDAGETTRLSSFQGVRGDEERIRAYYSPNFEQLNQFKDENEGHVMFGPHFSWIKGKLRMRGFSFETGDWLHKYFDQEGRIWMKSVSIRHGNEAFMKLFDQQENLVAYHRGPGDYDREYEGEMYSEIEGKEVSDDKFFEFVSRFRTNRLETSKTEDE